MKFLKIFAVILIALFTAKKSYADQIIINRGGTYTGSWDNSIGGSRDPNKSAVLITTSEPVILEKCTIRGNSKALLIAFSSDPNIRPNLTIRKCYIYGEAYLETGKDPAYPVIVSVTKAEKLIIENNYMENTSGIRVIGNPFGISNFNGAADDVNNASPTVSIQKNISKNIWASFIQIMHVNDLKGLKVEIAWNEIINEPRKSDTGDVMMMHTAHASAINPILIRNNFIQGVFPVDLDTNTSFGGSGINASDGRGNGDPRGNLYAPDRVTSNVIASDNQVIGCANVGMFISAGNNNKLLRNRIVCGGKFIDSDGLEKPIRRRFTGIYVLDTCKKWDSNVKCKGNLLNQGDADSYECGAKQSTNAYYNNTAQENVVGYYNPGSNRRSDYAVNQLYVPHPTDALKSTKDERNNDVYFMAEDVLCSASSFSGGIKNITGDFDFIQTASGSSRFRAIRDYYNANNASSQIPNITLECTNCTGNKMINGPSGQLLNYSQPSSPDIGDDNAGLGGSTYAITLADEAKEVELWRQKVRNNRIQLGPQDTNQRVFKKKKRRLFGINLGKNF